MKYFVTGATGFIGGQVARQLIAAGHEVVALARSPSKATALTGLGIEVHAGDITEKESMRAPMTGVDGVFHIAAWYKIGVKEKKDAEAINVGGTRNVLELMKDLAIPKGVYTSTLAVFSDTQGRVVDETYRYSGKHISEYDRTKAAAHYEVAVPMIESGLPLVIVQPGLVYGPGDSSSVREAFVQYLTGKLPASPEQTSFCWSHVDDAARGHILAMERGKSGESYIIAGPVHTFREAFELAEEITGVKAPRIHPKPGMLKAMAAVMEKIGTVVPLPDAYTGESLRVIAGVTYLGSNEKAQRELGYGVRPLREGLTETLHHEMRLLGMTPKAKATS